MQQTTKALHEIYDECSRRTILSRIEVSHENLNLFFGMKNPNLKSDVDATYKLVPMTLAEAQTELQNLYDRRCCGHDDCNDGSKLDGHTIFHLHDLMFETLQ